MAKKDKSSAKTKSIGSEKSKGTKQSKGKDSKLIDDDISSYWEDNLINASINDGTYKCNVVFLVETDLSNTTSIEWFRQYAELGFRHAVKSICKSDTMKQLRQTVQEKTHPLRGVCTAANQQLKSGELSVEMLAKYLKYMIIRLKEDDISRRKLLQVRAVKHNEQLLRDDIETVLAERAQEAEGMSKGGSEKKGKKGKDKEGKKGKGKSEGSKKENKGKGDKKKGASKAQNSEVIPDELLDKIDSKMRKQGEEWLDIEDIDDSPPNGAELYVVLSEFFDWQLVLEMMKIGVPVQAVIRAQTTDISDQDLETDKVSSFIPRPKKEHEKRESMIVSLCDKHKFNLEPLFSKTEAETETLAQDIMSFWVEYDRLVVENDPLKQKFLQNVAIFTYSTPDKSKAHTMSDCYFHSQMLYDEISKLLYDIEETSRLHIKYIRGMKVLPINEENVSTNLSGYDIYNTMVQLLPSECTVASFVLHCMVEQIDISMNRASTSINRSEPSVAHLINPDDVKIRTMLSDVNSRIKQLNEEYGLFQVPSELVVRRDPLVLMFGDKITQKTYHIMLPEVNLCNINRNILKGSHMAALWNHYKPHDESESLKFEFHLHMLRQCMGQSKVSVNILYKYLHLMGCNKIECLYKSKETGVCLRKNNVLHILAQCQQKENIANDDLVTVVACGTFEEIEAAEILKEKEIFTHDLECIKEMFSCPDIVGLITPNGANAMNEAMSDIVGVEEFKVNIMLQVLSKAYETYNCFEWKYFPPTDVLLLNFHDAMDKEGLKQQEWMASLRTPVAFRDFQEYVIEEEVEWAKENVSKDDSEQLLAEKSELNDNKTESTGPPLQNNFIQGEDYILQGSIKHDLLLAKNAEALPAEDQKGKKGKKKDKDGKKEPKSKGKSKDTKSSDKTKASKSKDKGEKGKKENSSIKGKSSKSKDSKNALPPELEVKLPIVKRLSLRSWKEGEPFSFIGYDLGTLRVQTSGTTTYFFSDDGTTVRARCAQRSYSEQVCAIEHVHLGHSMTFHSIAGPVLPAVQLPVIFHITSTFGTILAFEKVYKKPEIVVPEPHEELTVREEIVDKAVGNKRKKSSQKSLIEGDKKEQKGSGKKTPDKKSKSKKKLSSAEKQPQVEDEPETPNEELHGDASPPPPPPPEPTWNYKLAASWPSGLIIETVVGSSEHDPFHIKQKYLQKGPQCDKIRDEDYRIFLSNGTVLKFMTNGSVEILYSDSTVVLCKKFWKPVHKRDSFLIEVKPDNQSEQDGVNICYEVIDPRPPRLPLPLPPLSPIMEITDYHAILPSGQQYRVVDGEINYKFDKFLLRTATDFFLGEVFTRRGDGTHVLLQPDGKLIVAYPDGTRITTSFTIDDEPLTLEWTEEEKANIRYLIEQAPKPLDVFVQSPPSKSHQSLYSSISDVKEKVSQHMSVSPSTENEENSMKHEPEANDSFDDLFKDDGFVSVNLVSCAEHPNYSTVSYQNRERSALIEMPQNMNITISPEGLYTANIDGFTKLKVEPDIITLSSSVCNNCAATSRTIVDLTGFTTSGTSAVLSQTTDSHGHKFKIHYDGSSEFKAKQAPDHVSSTSLSEELSYKSYEIFTVIHNSDDLAKDSAYGMKESINSEKIVSEQDQFCLTKVTRKPRHFMLRRDLTGCEFIDGAELYSDIEAAREIVGAAVVTDEIQNNSDSSDSSTIENETEMKTRLQYHTILAPVLKTESEKWLMEYKSKHVLPHNLRKKDLRSTYGDPPTWYHPLPIKKAITREPAGDKAQKNDGRGEEITMSEVFTLRVVQEMQYPTEDIKRGLLKYRAVGREKTSAYTQHPMEDPRTSSQRSIERHLLRQALGDSFASLQDLFRRRYRPPRPPPPEAKQHPEQMEHFAERSVQNAVDKAAYERLLREHDVPPYFMSQPGESFLAVMKAMMEAIEISEEKTEDETEKVPSGNEGQRDANAILNKVLLIIEK